MEVIVPDLADEGKSGDSARESSSSGKGFVLSVTIMRRFTNSRFAET